MNIVDPHSLQMKVTFNCKVIHAYMPRKRGGGGQSSVRSCIFSVLPTHSVQELHVGTVTKTFWRCIPSLPRTGDKGSTMQANHEEGYGYFAIAVTIIQNEIKDKNDNQVGKLFEVYWDTNKSTFNK